VEDFTFTVAGPDQRNRPSGARRNNQTPKRTKMFHVKHFGTIDGAKILVAPYIRRLETGKNARKTGAIARKSVTRPRLRSAAKQWLR
jgi:hypothetical protein